MQRKICTFRVSSPAGTKQGENRHRVIRVFGIKRQFWTLIDGWLLILVNVGNHSSFSDRYQSFLYSFMQGSILFSASEVRKQTQISNHLYELLFKQNCRKYWAFFYARGRECPHFHFLEEVRLWNSVDLHSKQKGEKTTKICFIESLRMVRFRGKENYLYIFNFILN